MSHHTILKSGHLCSKLITLVDEETRSGRKQRIEALVEILDYLTVMVILHSAQNAVASGRSADCSSVLAAAKADLEFLVERCLEAVWADFKKRGSGLLSQPRRH